MTDKQIKKLRCFIEFYGKENQIIKAVEECAELQQRLCNTFTKQANTSLIAEEIADVKIMLEQMQIIFNCSSEVENWVDFKIQRQIERMKNE